MSWLALDPSTQPLAERLCTHLGGPHARTENSTSGPGPLAIFGVQLLFAGTLSQFLLAPLLWTFWLAFLALPHPLTGFMPNWAFYTLGGI